MKQALSLPHGLQLCQYLKQFLSDTVPHHSLCNSQVSSLDSSHTFSLLVCHLVKSRLAWAFQAGIGLRPVVSLFQASSIIRCSGNAFCIIGFATLTSRSIFALVKGTIVAYQAINLLQTVSA